MAPHRLGQTQSSPSRKKNSNLRVRPFRQDRFDGLCALYAILNAVRLCVEDHPLYDDEIWPELFGFLVEGLASEIDFAEIVLSGLPPKAMKTVLSNAARFLKEKYAIDLIVQRPIDAGERLNARDVLKRLKVLAQRPRTALLIWVKLDDQISHWTVIERFHSRSLSLLDSAGFRSLRRSEFRMTYEPTPGRDDRRSLIIKPRRIFLIRPA